MERRACLALSATALATLAGCSTSGGDATTTEETTTTTAAEETTTTTTTAAEETATTTTTEETATTTTTTEETTTTTTAAEETTATTTTAAEETTTTEETATTTTTTTAARESVAVVVGPDGNLRFDPETFRLATGGTVRWEWESGGHNVKPASTPEGSDWGGTEGGPGDTFSADHTYERTFDVAGEYEYYCAPHRDFGMTGSFTVV